MKHLIYYSPYIPLIGLVTALLYETCISEQHHYWYTVLVQSVVVGFLVQSII